MSSRKGRKDRKGRKLETKPPTLEEVDKLQQMLDELREQKRKEKRK